MKEVWTLKIRTSLPDICHSGDILKEETHVFDCFEKAKVTLRSRLKEFSFETNTMFDGNGNMTYMKKYMEEVIEYDTEAEELEGWLGGIIATKTLEIFSSIFRGEDVKTDFVPGIYENGMVEIEFSEDAIAIRGTGDGPINGYMPKANTNLFSMNEEKDYYIYLDDMFGQWVEASSELYIDLTKVTVE